MQLAKRSASTSPCPDPLISRPASCGKVISQQTTKFVQEDIFPQTSTTYGSRRDFGPERSRRARKRNKRQHQERHEQTSSRVARMPWAGLRWWLAAGAFSSLAAALAGRPDFHHVSADPTTARESRSLKGKTEASVRTTPTWESSPAGSRAIFFFVAGPGETPMLVEAADRTGGRFWRESVRTTVSAMSVRFSTAPGDAGVFSRGKMSAATEAILRTRTIGRFHRQQQQQQQQRQLPLLARATEAANAEQVGMALTWSASRTSFSTRADGDARTSDIGGTAPLPYHLADGGVKRRGGVRETVKKVTGLSSQPRGGVEQSLEEAGTDGGGGGEGEAAWCPRAAVAAACETEPRLKRVMRAFEARHPDATIIFLALAGSRLYGTDTPESDLDVRGLYIPSAPRPPTCDTTKMPRDKRGRKRSKDDVGSGTTPAKSHAQGRRPKKLTVHADDEFPLEEAFWFSTSDSGSANTVEDVDLEMVSLDRFFVQLLRAEIAGLETLFSMLVPKAIIISHPLAVPLLRGQRRRMVSSNTSSWVGFARNHLARFRKNHHAGRQIETDGVPRSDNSSRGEGMEDERALVDVLGETAEGEGEREGKREGGGRNDEKVRGGKLLSQARRSVVEAEELLLTGKITFPLAPARVAEIRRLKECQAHNVLQKQSRSIAKSLGELINRAGLSALPPAPDRSTLKTLRDEIMWMHGGRDWSTSDGAIACRKVER